MKMREILRVATRMYWKEVLKLPSFMCRPTDSDVLSIKNHPDNQVVNENIHC
jgi:hypothetical protein